MKRFLNKFVPVVAVGFFLYLGVEFLRRALTDAPGDPLVPLMFGVLIIMGSAIFQQVSKPMMLLTPDPQIHENTPQRAELN